MSYLVMAPGGSLIEKSTVLRLAGVVPMTGLGADRTLTPTFPGIEEAEDIAAWDPPFPVDLSVIRPKDEDVLGPSTAPLPRPSSPWRRRGGCGGRASGI